MARPQNLENKEFICKILQNKDLSTQFLCNDVRTFSICWSQNIENA